MNRYKKCSNLFYGEWVAVVGNFSSRHGQGGELESFRMIRDGILTGTRELWALRRDDEINCNNSRKWKFNKLGKRKGEQWFWLSFELSFELFQEMIPARTMELIGND